MIGFADLSMKVITVDRHDRKVRLNILQDN